jgi:hypothetical protein
MAIKHEDYVWVIVQRVINGQIKRYVERFASRLVEDYRLDGLFLDSFVSYIGINETTTTMTITTGGAWTAADLLTVTASAPVFEAGNVGNGVTLWVPSADPIVVRIEIENFVSPTVITGHIVAVIPAGSVPSELRNTATVFWSRAVDTVTGLDHLEGADVGILANGVPLTGTVSLGTVTLPQLYDVVHVGLPITADLWTLDLDSPQDEIRDRKKIVRTASLLVDRSRGHFQAGPDFDNLETFTPEGGVALETDVFTEGGGDLLNEIVEVQLDTAWKKPGRIAVRHTEPLPLSVLGIIHEGMMGK